MFAPATPVCYWWDRGNQLLGYFCIWEIDIRQITRMHLTFTRVAFHENLTKISRQISPLTNASHGPPLCKDLLLHYLEEFGHEFQFYHKLYAPTGKIIMQVSKSSAGRRRANACVIRDETFDMVVELKPKFPSIVKKVYVEDKKKEHGTTQYCIVISCGSNWEVLALV